VGFPQINYQEGVIIPEVFTAENSVAKQAGIQAGDIVLAINDQPLGASQNAIIDFRDIIQSSPDQPLKLTIKRPTETLDLIVTPELGSDGQGKIGVRLAPNGEETRLKADNFGQAFSLGAGEFQAIARNDAGNLFQFAALISINLAVINILPLPALDGGQLVFLLIEALVGKPLPTKLQDNIMQTGLVLLLGLGVFLIVRDTANLAVFQDLFQ